ncbi:MAG: hypothetical protein KDA87_20585, partial [Planctomycetales bacterium]|nr:hypothetical protein [Planctomycetales bacterium]
NLDKVAGITDEGLANLTSLDKLTWIHVGSNYLTDACVPHLSELKTLKHLEATFNRDISAEGQAKLKAALPECNVLF